MECRQEQNKKYCNCTYPGCSRKNVCCECLHYHRRMGELPACYFPAEAKRTYDCSIEQFLALH